MKQERDLRLKEELKDFFKHYEPWQGQASLSKPVSKFTWRDFMQRMRSKYSMRRHYSWLYRWRLRIRHKTTFGEARFKYCLLLVENMDDSGEPAARISEVTGFDKSNVESIIAGFAEKTTI